MSLCGKCRGAINKLARSHKKFAYLYEHDADTLDESVAYNCFMCVSLWVNLTETQRKALRDPEEPVRTIDLCTRQCIAQYYDGFPWILEYREGYRFPGIFATLRFSRADGK